MGHSPPADDSPPVTTPPAKPDAKAPPGYQAWVYASDPIRDNGQLAQVTLAATSSPAGKLSNEFVSVSNCLNELGGPSSTQNIAGLELKVSFCHEVPTAKADEDGNYLAIRPPADETDPNDAFAEVMMYHHVNQIHRYFHDTFGFTDLDYPLPAIVNVQFKIEPPIPFLRVGPDGWSSFPNAAFFPKDNWNQLASTLGLPQREKDAIIFGQAEADFSYDAHVIYHEYTHAVIGTARLTGRVADAYGLDDSPRSMNEGLADYFAATRNDDAVIGRYGIGKLSPRQVRDVAQGRRCPDDLVAEVHADGKIISSAMWALRQEVGKEKADQIVFDAVEQFTEGTTLERAGALIAAEAAKVGPETEAVAHRVLESHGVESCVRAKPWLKFTADSSAEGLPYPVDGTQTAEVPGFDQWVPGFFGFYIDVPAGQHSVTLHWSLGQSGLGGFGGFGGASGQPQLALAVRHGAPVTIRYGAGAPEREEDALVEPPSIAEPNGSIRQSVTLQGQCLPPEGGRVYLMFVNRQATRATITAMDLEARGAAETEAAGAPAVTAVDCASIASATPG